MAGKAQAAKVSPAVEARVIAVHPDHAIDEIVTGAKAEQGISDGWADGSADAVAFAKSRVEGEG